jgi:hypothetical protein
MLTCTKSESGRFTFNMPEDGDSKVLIDLVHSEQKAIMWYHANNPADLYVMASSDATTFLGAEADPSSLPQAYQLLGNMQGETVSLCLFEAEHIANVQNIAISIHYGFEFMTLKEFLIRRALDAKAGGIAVSILNDSLPHASLTIH